MGSIGQLTRPADQISVVVPADREYVFSEMIASAARTLPIRTVRCRVDAALDQGFVATAGEVDVVLFVPEGVILDPDYLAILSDKVRSWDDLVGEIDIVHRAIKLPIDAPIPSLEDLRRRIESGAVASLRKLLRARSAMASLLWVRVAACGNIQFVHMPTFCGFIGFALFLDRLRCRGRTAMLFTDHARHIRLLPERRMGFDVGYALFSRLLHIASYDDQHASSPRRPSYLVERLEMARLLGEQALQLVVSPRSKRYVVAFLQGMWAARRDSRVQDRRLRREIRELS